MLHACISSRLFINVELAPLILVMSYRKFKLSFGTFQQLHTYSLVPRLLQCINVLCKKKGMGRRLNYADGVMDLITSFTGPGMYFQSEGA